MTGSDPCLSDGPAGIQVLGQDPAPIGFVAGGGVEAQDVVETPEHGPPPAIEDPVPFQHIAGVQRDPFQVSVSPPNLGVLGHGIVQLHAEVELIRRAMARKEDEVDVICPRGIGSR